MTVNIKLIIICLIVANSIAAQKVTPKADRVMIDQQEMKRLQQLRMDYANLARYRKANAALAPAKPDEKRVVFLGNSITEGWYRIDSAFFKQHNFIGRGISGQTSMQLLLRFRQDVVALQPDLVVIHIGTNDVAENTGPYQAGFTFGNIQSMTEIAKANGIKVIIAAVLPSAGFRWNKKLGDRSQLIVDLNNRLKTYAMQNDLVYADYHSAMKNANNGMDKDLAADGVHPTKKGYAIMKSLILPAVQTTLKQP